MLLPLPPCSCGRMTSKPTFSYMLRMCGILKSWLSPSCAPLKSSFLVPVGSRWHWLHVRAPASRVLFWQAVRPLFGLPVAVAPPPLCDGTVMLEGMVLSRLRNGLGG